MKKTNIACVVAMILLPSCARTTEPADRVVMDGRPAIWCLQSGSNSWLVQEVDSGCVMLNYGLEGGDRHPDVAETDLVLRDFGWVGVSCTQVLSDPGTLRDLAVATSVTGWISGTDGRLNVSLDGDFGTGRTEAMRVADLDRSSQEGIVECPF